MTAKPRANRLEIKGMLTIQKLRMVKNPIDITKDHPIPKII